MSWIKTKDRLPRSNGYDVLAVTEDGGYIVAFYSDALKRWYLGNGACIPLADGYVVAWQRIEEYNWEDDE